MPNTYSRSNRGFSLIELLIVVAIIMILAAIAIPSISQALMLSRETAAMRQVGTIQTAETQYYSQFEKFAGQLSELGPPSNGHPGPNGANLISAEFAAGRRSGFVFQVQISPTGFIITASPAIYNSSGRRSFYSDETGVIRHNWGPEPATANSPEAK